MVAQYRSVREIVTEVVAQSIKPSAHSAGFKKDGFTFRRHHGELTKVINVQLSHGNYGIEGGFYVNVGLAFDTLYELEGVPIDERPVEYKCHFRRRIAYFCSGAPDKWVISNKTDLQSMMVTLTENTKTVLQALDPIASISDFLVHDRFRTAQDSGLLARLHYVSGNLEEAWQDVKHEAEVFRERKGMSVDDLITRFHLSALREFQDQQHQ